MTEQLEWRARQSYEFGRLVVAARVALPVLLLTALCALESSRRARTVTLGITLLMVAWMLRWRLYRGNQLVTVGMWAGIIPLTAALALCRFAPYCPPALAFALCAGLGIVAGATIAKNCAPLAGTPTQWLATMTVSVLTASMGCLAIGVGTALGASAGVLVGTAVTASLARRAV